MKIAVIGQGFYPTLDWIRKELATGRAIYAISVADSRILLEDGTEFVIVQGRSDVQGRLFHGYIIAPTYFDLVGFVKKHCEIKQEELPRLELECGKSSTN